MSNPFDIAVHVYQENMELPTTGTYFLVTGNGLWLHKDMPNFRGFVPVKDISVLPDLNVESFAVCKLPKIPVKIGYTIRSFFNRVVGKYHSEACTVLYYNRDANDWKVYVPKQIVSHGGVNYVRTGLENIEGMDGYTPVGTIHSHADFNAFHSGTDEFDEQTFDGLHITFGHNHMAQISISSTFVVNGQRFKLKSEDVLEGFTELVPGFYSTTEVFPEIESEVTEWMKNVRSYNEVEKEQS